jgi:hypothetical protein
VTAGRLHTVESLQPLDDLLDEVDVLRRGFPSRQSYLERKHAIGLEAGLTSISRESS